MTLPCDLNLYRHIARYRELHLKTVYLWLSGRQQYTIQLVVLDRTTFFQNVVRAIFHPLNT